MKITKDDLARLNSAIMEINKVYGELFAKLTLDDLERERLRQQFYVASSNDKPTRTDKRAEFSIAFPPLALPSPPQAPKKLKVVNERTSAVRELKNKSRCREKVLFVRQDQKRSNRKIQKF